MNDAAAEGSPDAAICPYFERAVVAAAGDSEKFTPRPEQRCFSPAEPVAVSPQHQAVFCLTGRHPECSRYRRRAAPKTASVQTSRHYVLSAIAVLLAVGAATALSVVVIGNPLSVEPDSSTSPTPAAAFAESPTPAPPDASGIDSRVPPMPATATSNAATAETPPATPRPPTATSTIAPAGTATPFGTATPVSTGIAAVSYTVQPGDTLIGLARRFDLSVPVLAAANGLGPADGLRIGQILRIPDAASPAPTPAAR